MLTPFWRTLHRPSRRIRCSSCCWFIKFSPWLCGRWSSWRLWEVEELQLAHDLSWRFHLCYEAHFLQITQWWLVSWNDLWFSFEVVLSNDRCFLLLSLQIQILLNGHWKQDEDHDNRLSMKAWYHHKGNWLWLKANKVEKDGSIDQSGVNFLQGCCVSIVWREWSAA